MWDPVSVSSCVFSVVFQFSAFPEMLIVTLGGILQFPSSLNTWRIVVYFEIVQQTERLFIK